MKLFSFAPLLFCGACSAAHTTASPIKNGAFVDDSRIAQVVEEFKEKMPALNLNQISIVVDNQTRKHYCDGITDACTYHIRSSTRYSIVHVPWNNVYEPQQLLAHELCHVYYFQTADKADPNHTHKECFDDIAKSL